MVCKYPAEISYTCARRAGSTSEVIPVGFCIHKAVHVNSKILYSYTVFSIFFFFPKSRELSSCTYIYISTPTALRCRCSVILIVCEQQVGFWRKPSYKSFRKSARTRVYLTYTQVYYTPSGCKRQCRPRLQLVCPCARRSLSSVHSAPQRGQQQYYILLCVPIHLYSRI